MRKVQNYIKFVAMISMLAVLILTPTSAAFAGSNGQQVAIFACNAARVVLQGYNQQGKSATYTLNNPGCGRVYITGWWWKTWVGATAYYNLSAEHPYYAGQSMTVYVPPSQSNSDWYFVNFSTPSTRQWILWRASTWVNDRISYGTGSYHDGYRQDCSGFVSFAWSTGYNYNTSTLMNSNVSYVISYDSLQPGDALDSPTGGHAILFLGWVNQGAGTFIAFEENIWPSPGYAQQHQATLNKSTGQITATDGHFYYGYKYYAIRKNGL